MTDRDPFELEMSPGIQPSSGLGDRILVGLALMTLIGGGLIAVGNMLPDPDEVAQASTAPSGGPERTPRPSPTPAPPRIAILQASDGETEQIEQPRTFEGWIRATTDLVIRNRPVSDAEQVGLLLAGEAAYASQQDQPADEQGWLLLGEPQGWVATVAGGEQLAERYVFPRYRSSGWIYSVSPGPDGFVATVVPPAGQDDYEPPSAAFSADGASWRLGSSPTFNAWGVSTMAWGPAGWLAASYDYDGSLASIWLWGSSDGLSWSRLGVLGGISGEYVIRLLATEHGYLLETNPEQRGFTTNGSNVWSSADGQTWHESNDPVLDQRILGERKIAAVEEGFYLWDAGRVGWLGAFSIDGQRWSEDASGPRSPNLQLTALHGTIIAIDVDQESGGTHAWSGTLVDGQVAWIRETASDAAFAGAVVRQLVSDGRRAYAFGWDRTTEAPLVWTGDGVNWLRARLPESFEGLPAAAAAGRAGVVVVGYRPTLRGENPIFWHLTTTGQWLPEADPLLPAVPDPSGEDCPALPTDYLAFTVVDAAAVVACHGTAPITFQAFSTACNQCYGTQEGNPEPAWLLNPTSNQLYLSPTESTTGWSNTAILRPPLVANTTWTGTWLQLTGHFDDPAAQSCHVDPIADMWEYWTGRHSLIYQCRMTFVVTGVTVISPP